MKNKLFAIVLTFLLALTFVGCTEECEQCEECLECEECEECEICNPVDLTPSPVVTPLVYHWVPGAITGDVTATLNVNGATTLKVLLGGKVLEDLIDYELAAGTLTIFGQTLDDLGLEVGSHVATVVTENGTADFTIEVVANASLASSIEKQTIKGVNMSSIATVVPTEVIADAPDLMITEVGVDMYEYTYVEVYNNTNADYNLKNHRIVYSDLAKQSDLTTKELFDEPLGMAGAAFIYQDYIIPAFGTAVIWVVASYPWAQAEGLLLDGVTLGRVMSETEDAAAHLFGSNPDNLSIEKFRAVYGLPETTLVFPVRPQPCLVNGTSVPDTNGLGAAPIKGASGRLATFNSSTANRGVQIQKFDLDAQFTVTDIAGASYYKYEVGVLNKEEDVYTEGAFDRTKIAVYGGRESVNALYARIAYYDATNVLVGYANGAAALDLYNADKAATLKMYSEIVTPISTALIYGTYVEVETVLTLTAWGAFRSLEYTIPASATSTLMRYIPLAGTRTVYETQFADAADVFGALKLSGVATEAPEINANSDLSVPVSTAYSTDYLSTGYNTIGRGINANFVPVVPAA